MNDKEKQLIINEINKWRQSKLLPSAYCDFLLNLYTSGDKPGKASDELSQLDQTIPFGKIAIAMAMLAILAAVIYVGTNFSSFPIFVQILILLAITTIMYGATIIYKSKGKNSIILLILHSVASVILALVGMYGAVLLGTEDGPAYVQSIFFCIFIIWFFMSLWLKHLITFVASLFGMTVIYYQYVNSFLEYSLIMYQLYWIPLCLVILWLAYAFNQYKHLYYQSIVLLICSVLYMFIPEILFYLKESQTTGFLFSLPVKMIAVLALVIFITKNAQKTVTNHTEA